MTTQKPTDDAKENDAEVRMIRYLYIGKEYTEYQPGNWFVHQYYSTDRVPSIEEMAIDKNTETKPVEIIETVFNKEKNLVQNFETLVFALAVCARQNKSEKLRHLAYSKVKSICSAPQHFLLFIKFANQIAKKSETKHGWGHGWKKAVEEWYNSKNHLELAECVTRYKSRYGWKHKDILKLSHIPTGAKIEDKAQFEQIPEPVIVKNMIFCYVMNGLKELKKKYGDVDDHAISKHPKAVEIIKYLENVEDFKHCEDEVRAGGLVEINNFTLDHVPGHLLKSEEVWNSLLVSMDYATLLENLQRIHNLGFLKPDSVSVAKVLDTLSSEEKILSEKIHPAHILIAAKNYENSGKPLSYEKRKVREEAKKQHPPPPKMNQKIVDALYKSLNVAFSHVEATGLRYLITVDMGEKMQVSPVWHCGNMNAAEVGCLLALSLLRSEKNVTVATFEDVGIHTANLEKNSTFGQALRRMQQLPTGTVNLSKPMSWASYQNKKYDVFISVVHQITLKDDTSAEEMTSYRTKMSLPEAKLINCVLCDSTAYRLQKQIDKNILTICGFDHCVPKIIEAFSKSFF